jgi:SagB-type dehydrogenase family enzyme
MIKLPPPKITGGISLNEAILMRRSVRNFSSQPITLEHLSQILWSAQGINELRQELRTSPSAGATYPLILYVVVGTESVRYENGFLREGVYRYDWRSHTLISVREGDIRKELYLACLNQEWILNAPISVIIAADYRRTTWRYGSRGIRYVHMEVGHVGQNIYLQVAALGLGTVAVGAFEDGKVKKILSLPPNEEPLYIMPVGVSKKERKVEQNELIEYFEINRRRKTAIL